jgi:hypothetical protein
MPNLLPPRHISTLPFSELRERLLNMPVVERVRFAFYRRSLRGR